MSMIPADNQRHAIALARAFAQKDWNSVVTLQPKSLQEAKDLVNAFAFVTATLAADARLRGAVTELDTLMQATIELEAEAAA